MCRMAIAIFMSACSAGTVEKSCWVSFPPTLTRRRGRWTARSTSAGAAPDVTGPYIQGRPGGRFIYLSWVTVDDSDSATMFRRAKLWLDSGVPSEILISAARRGRLLGRLRLTDAKGNPLCAAVRPPSIEWSCPES
jgi:Family of unknown function (DUF5990)